MRTGPIFLRRWPPGSEIWGMANRLPKSGEPEVSTAWAPFLQVHPSCVAYLLLVLLSPALLLVPSCSQGLKVTCYPLTLVTVPLPGQMTSQQAAWDPPRRVYRVPHGAEPLLVSISPAWLPWHASSWPKPCLRALGSEGLMPRSSSPTHSELCHKASVPSRTYDFLF